MQLVSVLERLTDPLVTVIMAEVMISTVDITEIDLQPLLEILHERLD